MDKTRITFLVEEAKKLIAIQKYQTADERLNLASFLAIKNPVIMKEIMGLRKLLYTTALDQSFPIVKSSFETGDCESLHTLVDDLDVLILYASRANQPVPPKVTELRNYIADVYYCRNPRPLVHNHSNIQ